MLSFDAGSHRFDLRAAAIVRRPGAVLLHRLERDTFWALPGGRVEAGEAAADTVVRVMHEELGVTVACGALRLVVENFFGPAGQARHEVGLYFDATPAAGSFLLERAGPYAGREGEQVLVFDWFDAVRLAAADVRPSLLAASLLDESAPFGHVVQRG